MCPSGVSLDSSEVPAACVTLCLQGNSVGCREIHRFSARYQYVSQTYLYKMQCMMQGQNQSMSLAREQALSFKGKDLQPHQADQTPGCHCTFFFFCCIFRGFSVGQR